MNMGIKKELLYVLPVLVLITAIGLSPSISLGKIPGGHILEIRVEDIVVFLLALYWLKRILIDKEKMGAHPVLLRPDLLLPISLWLGFLFVTTTINVFLGNVSVANSIFYYLKELEFFFIYFFIYCHIKNPANVRWVLKLFAAIALIHAGWILFQSFFGLRLTYFYNYTTFIEPEGTSPGGMFLLVLFAILFSAFLYEYFQRTHSWIKRAAMGLVAASPVVGIITSGSRGTFLSFVAMLMVMALMLFLRRVSRAALVIVVSGIIIFVVALIAGYVFSSADILNKNDALRVFRSESVFRSLDSNNPNARPFLWKFNLERAAEQPIEFLFIGGGKSFTFEQQAHNYYLQAFNEGGLIGLALFLFLLSSILVYAWRGFMSPGDNLTVGLSAGLIAATLGMMVSSFFAESFQVVKSAEIYWVFVALALFAAHYARGAKPDKSHLSAAATPQALQAERHFDGPLPTRQASVTIAPKAHLVGEDFVSVIIPCYNEEKHIDKCIQSFVEQDYPSEKIEVLIVDGMSTDATRDLVHNWQRTYSNIYLIDNPSKITPVALNSGIRKAKGNVIIRADAHASYRATYVSKCVTYLQELKVDNVGGVIETLPGANTLIARAIALSLSSILGVGNSYFRRGIKNYKFVDTVFGGCWRREIFDRVGFFNENLRRSQDFEFNKRLRKQGGIIVLAPDIVSCYYARPTFWGFFLQNIKDGFWVTYPLKFTYDPFSLRHYIPGFAVFLFCALSIYSFWSLLSLLVLLGLIGLYVILTCFVTIGIVSRERDIRFFFIMPLVFVSRHVAYGIGSLVGLIRVLI